MAKAARVTADGPLFEGGEWTFDTVERTYEAIERVALGEFGLDVYPNQLEVITTEQMLDAYSSIGMPQMYRHWSFGKHFAYNDMLYRKGMRGLAYELVINSNPCITYIMQDNSMPMQALVMAHASFGHNHFFKNNNLFQQWTDAEAILDYLSFAKSYIARCEERYGASRVERLLDAAHALMDHGVNRYQRKRRTSKEKMEERRLARLRYEEETYSELWRTLPNQPEGSSKKTKKPKAERVSDLELPEENILYFLEKAAPKLDPWERDVIRIVRLISQYFYPQKQTKVMNEGCATYVHYMICNRMFDHGLLSEGAMLEILQSHSSVTFQPDFDDKRFSGINPYRLGFEIMSDIHRMCDEPTEEDRHWFPDLAGNGDPTETLKWAWSEFRDESFIVQFLSPDLIRRLRLFRLCGTEDSDEYVVDAIHNERGYDAIRKSLARQHDVSSQEPNIQIVAAELAGDRVLVLEHQAIEDRLLEDRDANAVLQHIAELWGYPVRLTAVDAKSRKILREYSQVSPQRND